MEEKPCRACPALAVALIILILLMPAVLVVGCGGEDEPILLAVTVDLGGSGILEAWVEDFRSRSGRRVELFAVTDEEAFAMARQGWCDLTLTHIYEDEESMARSGYVEDWREVMRDDFVLLGPPEDTAGIRDMVSPAEAFRKIADERRPYVLRVDGSGTASRQNALLIAAGVEEAGEWLLVTEGDTEEALRMASREGAYTLAARSDFERLANELELEILLEEYELLANPYRVAKVSAMVYPDTDIAGAREFIDYLLSEHARRFFDLGAWVPPEE